MATVKYSYIKTQWHKLSNTEKNKVMKQLSETLGPNVENIEYIDGAEVGDVDIDLSKQ